MHLTVLREKVLVHKGFKLDSQRSATLNPVCNTNTFLLWPVRFQFLVSGNFILLFARLLGGLEIYVKQVYGIYLTMVNSIFITHGKIKAWGADGRRNCAESRLSISIYFPGLI